MNLTESLFPTPSAFLTWSLKTRNQLPEQSRKTLEAYYKNYLSYFGDRSRKRYDRQFLEILDHLSCNSNARVLEIGCGCGTESLYFGILGADVTAIDVTSERLAAAVRRKEFVEKTFDVAIQTEFKQVNVLDLPIDHKFDLIWLEQAFHHCEPRDQVVEKIGNLLRPGGHVVFSEANPWHPLLSLSLFVRRGTNTIKTYTDDNGVKRLYGNERIITKSGLARWLAKVQIQEENYRYFNVFPNWRVFDRFAALEDKFPEIPAFFSHYNFVGRKA